MRPNPATNIKILRLTSTQKERLVLIFDISDCEFKNIMSDGFFGLPRRWDGANFYLTVEDLFNKYIEKIRLVLPSNDAEEIDKICTIILKSVSHYLNGYPEKAYKELSKALKILIGNPIKVYKKTGWIEPFFRGADPLKLFRIRNVQNNTSYKRPDIFHTPYNLRSKVSSCRYSIAGYPSLYLGTSLELCSEEAKVEHLKDLRLAARFELVRNQIQNGNSIINVIELAIKPQDFVKNYNEVVKDNYNRQSIPSRRKFDDIELSDAEVRSNYLLWYPLIASSSFIRVNKGDPFAAEYIIPQLFMQWIRTKYKRNELYGIRYFSCASTRASDMGFNYMFPVSGNQYINNPNFCSILAKTFKLTVPRFIHEYKTITECEKALVIDRDLDNI